MDAQLKVKLVEALRSGEYPQGSNYLERHGDYCCLGVLCAIQDSEWKKYFPSGDLQTEKLPLQLNAGLSADDRRTLACMNDEGKSFDYIADHIEANL